MLESIWTKNIHQNLSWFIEAFLEETCGTVANAFDIMAGSAKSDEALLLMYDFTMVEVYEIRLCPWTCMDSSHKDFHFFLLRIDGGGKRGVSMFTSKPWENLRCADPSFVVKSYAVLPNHCSSFPASQT